MERAKPTEQEVVKQQPKLHTCDFIPSGSMLLDLALGGGWASGRIFNLVGDASSGKTLLCIECLANYSRSYPKCRMRYGEAEAAFDEQFAAQLGFPSSVERPKDRLETVENFYNDLEEFSNLEGPSIYIIDSLDALSDAAELEDEIDKGSYGATKAKQLSKLFRRLNSVLEAHTCTLGIVSQIRDKLNVMFGEKHTRSGGKALNFYASQIVWLAEIEKIEKQIKGQKRAIGIQVKARVRKNKVGLPFREAEFPIIFGYGIDDLVSMIDWLKLIKAFSDSDYKNMANEIEEARDKQDTLTLSAISEILKKRVTTEWQMMEEALAPKLRKYL